MLGRPQNGCLRTSGTWADLKIKMPLTFWTFVMFTLAICGVPFTSGFLSKDEILAGTLAYANLTGRWYIPIIAFFVAGLTAFYMFQISHSHVPR